MSIPKASRKSAAYSAASTPLPRGASVRRGFRLCWQCVHRHAGMSRFACLQAGYCRGACERHRLFQPVHRRAWQLSARLDHRRRDGPRQSSRGRPKQDGFRLRRIIGRQGMARYLGVGPGHRSGRQGGSGSGTGGADGTGISGGQGRALQLTAHGPISVLVVPLFHCLKVIWRQG